MTATTKMLTILASLAALFVDTEFAAAAAHGIRDNANFFSESARTDAGRQIAEIERQFGKGVLIETFAAIPDSVKKDVNLEDKASANRLFEQWSAQQARQLNVNGIYVLLTREPAHLQIVVGNETQKQAFTLADRSALVSKMLERLRRKENDLALLDGIQFVQTTLRAHLPARGPARTSVTAPVAAPRVAEADTPPARPWLWILLALVGIGVILFIMGLFKAMTRGNATAGATPPVLGGGGGFFSSLLGGMFGAAAGMWLYNQFTGNHNTAWGADRSDLQGDDSFSRRDTDYSSSGGDFGDSSGGGDFSGGGDSGGGDF